MKELNELTRQLLAEGWKPEDNPPGTHPYTSHYGGWTYTGEAIRSMVWETPCGLLAEGRHFVNGYLAYHGIDWRPENGNPVITCPKFPSEPCPLCDPRLNSQRSSLHSDDVICQCNCHRTDRPYTYEGSTDELHDQVWEEAEKRWAVFKAEHGGRVCRHQSRYGRTSKTWKSFYDPQFCASMDCTYCDVLEKELSPRKGNVFYDLRRSWIAKGEGLFPEQQKVLVKKGCKLLKKSKSLTICEAIVQYGWRDIEDRIHMNHHHELFCDKTLKIEVINLRAARAETRDILQDLQDTADGIQVIHEADSLKAAKEQKQARRAASKKQRIQKVEKMILTCGWDTLDNLWKHRAQKLLDDERISELLQLRADGQLKPAQPALDQLSMFPEELSPPWEEQSYIA